MSDKLVNADHLRMEAERSAAAAEAVKRYVDDAIAALREELKGN